MDAEPPPAFASPAVAAAFDTFPAAERHGLLTLRALIFDVAARSPGTGQIEETLKWGQPAYLTPQTRSGTTIRLAPARSGGFGLFTHCQTRVIPEFRALFPDLRYDGNRGVLFDADMPLPLDDLRLLIGHALTYHLAERAG